MMMKYYIFVLFIGSLLACSAPVEKSATSVNNVSSTLQEDSVIHKEINLYDDSTWMAIKSEWEEKVFDPCLKAAKIKISCEDCIGIFINAQFFIGRNGQLEKYELLNSRFCNEAGLESNLLDYFKQLEFPEKYKKTSFRVYLGRLLKC